MYADETGNLDYDGEAKEGASAYFGFGTAIFTGDHGRALFEGLRLRARLEHEGVRLTEGFHAVNDAPRTRNEMFALVQEQAPRFDTTFLYKANAIPRVRAAGEMRLYQMAWYLHFKEIAIRVSTPSDTLFVIAGSFGTKARSTAARAALADVCSQVNRDIILCVWRAATSWGLQVADYGLWATQRQLEGKTCSWFPHCVEPTLESIFLPWGRK